MMKCLLNVRLTMLDDALQQGIASDNGSSLVCHRILWNDDPNHVHVRPSQCCGLQTTKFEKVAPNEVCKLTRSCTCFSAVFVILNSCPSISDLLSANSTSIFCWNSSSSSPDKALLSCLYITAAWADHERPGPKTDQ